MQTTKSNDGVITASIEETNRIRLELGLKPLDLTEEKKRPAPGPVSSESGPKKRRVDTSTERDGEIGIGHDKEFLERHLGGGEEIILTLKDSLIGEDEEDVLVESNIEREETRKALAEEWDGKIKNSRSLFISRTAESKLASDVTGFKKSVVEGNVVGIGDSSVNEYEGVANQLNTMTNLGTMSMDDEYKKRQNNISNVAALAREARVRRNATGTATTKALKDEPDEKGKSVVLGLKKDKDGGTLMTEFSSIDEFCAQVELPESRIQTIAEETLLRERLAKASQKHAATITSDQLLCDGSGATVGDDESSAEEEDQRAQVSFLDECQMDGGVAGVLDLLKKKGELKPLEKKQKLRVGGVNGYSLPQVVIERKDEFGNTLSLKEAFNQLSYRFHGKGPSLNKMEKVLRKRDMEKQEIDGTAVSKLPTLRALKSNQGRGQAYLNLQNNNKKL